MATSSTETPAAPEVASMTKLQKLAALMIVLGPEGAGTLLRQMNEAEMEAVTSEMTKITVVSQEMRMEVLREFAEVAVQAGTCTLGGLDFTRDMLEKSFGPFRASSIIGRVAPARSTPGAMQQILEMDARQIFNLLKQEQPQTIALVVSYLAAEKSSEFLMLLRTEARDQVIERLATMAPTPIEVVERVVELLNAKIAGRHTRALSQTGGIKTAADLLNSMDKSTSKALLVGLEERNPDLGAAIRQKMFTFEDLAQLDTAMLQKILREVEMRDLAMALKTASDRVKEALLASISKRAAETVNEEIGFMGPLRLRDIEGAQGRIIDVVRRLESEGEIELSAAGGGGDEIVA
ncbi:MAG: flagellar motor switch protein FliG [Verrucomicrobiae bacterium]|nr:flagellar motor switch protein FliG [Verrucomicrobiae bacterium]